MFYKNSTIQYPTSINHFVPEFNEEPNGGVTVKIKASLVNINTSLCSTNKKFACNVNVPGFVMPVSDVGVLEITGKHS